ncbi:MAG TPA: outer membrane lipoprotein-sorting protein [Myxococcota bacterium]|nr:outer membrane lipoprotein-sorting protein [Myxococcota bacterium]
MLRPVALALALAVALAPGLARLARADQVQLPKQKDVEDALPEGGTLTGRQIFDKFLDNRMRTCVQWQTVVSRDPGGNEQRTRFWVRWKDYRDKNKNPVDGVIAKVLVKFQEPEDMLDTGYLMIVNADRSNDEFMWSPAIQKVRRLQLRGVGIMGTDYTFDDIGWKNIEDAEYKRLPDDQIDGIPTYVLEVTMKPFVQSEYRTMRTWIDKKHYIPLRSIYRDLKGVDMREMIADSTTVQDFDGAWVPTKSTMYNLREKTSTTIYIEALDPNVHLTERNFSPFQLTLRH